MATTTATHHKADIGSILKTVARLYAGGGMRAASIRNIAQEVGLAPSALYYYFGSKQRMVQMALAEMGGVAHRSVCNGVGSEDEDEDEKFDRLIRVNLYTLAFDANYAPIHSRQVVSYANGESKHFPTSEYRSGIQAFVGLRPGGGAPTDLRTAFMICAMIHGFAELTRLEKQLAGGSVFTDEEKNSLYLEVLAAARRIAVR